MKLSAAAPFCEQVSELTRLFSQWNECEQTVVLYALLRRMPAVQARFLAEAVQHTLHSVSQLDTQELNANNSAFISGLMTESTEVAIRELLVHLPLLKPGNIDCKEAYLAAIPELINHCVSTGQFTHQVQQLLSYTLIHPAVTCQDRRALGHWLHNLEDRIRNTPTIQSMEEYANHTSAPRWDNTWSRKLTDIFNTNLNGTMFGVIPPPPPPPPPLQPPAPISRQRRSNSLTPPVATSHHHELVDRTSNANNSSRHKPRSFSVSGDHASRPVYSGSLIGLGPLSPQGSCASSGSEGRLDDANRSLASGMRDVPVWLKTLRLHKYSTLFSQLSYEDMLALTEDKLVAQGVTKGASHKLEISIGKLKQRYNTLVNLEKDLLLSTDAQASSFTQGPTMLVNVTDELKTILTTPMRPSQESDPQDIPQQYTRVLGKLYTKLALENVDDNILCAGISIFEKVLQHDCFTTSQKDKVQQWRTRLGNPRQTSKWQQNYGYNNRRYGNSQQHNRKPSLNSSNVHSTHNTHNSHSSYMVSPHRNHSISYYQNSSNQAIAHLRPTSIEKRSSLQETTSLQQMQKSFYRTNSAPRDHFVEPEASGSNETKPSSSQSTAEINDCLESLCLRMTEQALDTFGDT
ncbi:protein Smaug homolog 1 isoform X1 [Harpegnathos saltator]|uniref:protein Smaug homolog 1 isoform X1 n=1 Tax=Harpegnathos saltator TaxID=610380 RepID=UPI0005912699|nr:protein Smaug homolog 1 isoform X1 [Harpegnathos saltator]XP_011148939.1 protein Smaug homolog 1 isoform X1 [Harpegnathos saltator]XP_011148940.1 protein Smaug homolog 1 isoform X1 [Harpegnathos saltator]XP_019699583.1 protein Smaug homolog 1 isoform X1 [Harpegnathos saltator]XP_025154327.1 protein Smaug homolog 1 isoform X1 [Harpegnathos saltator]